MIEIGIGASQGKIDVSPCDEAILQGQKRATLAAAAEAAGGSRRTSCEKGASGSHSSQKRASVGVGWGAKPRIRAERERKKEKESSPKSFQQPIQAAMKHPTQTPNNSTTE